MDCSGVVGQLVDGFVRGGAWAAACALLVVAVEMAPLFLP